MSAPRCGWRYASVLPGGSAEEFLVLTEDEWNDVMRDSVAVPVFREEPVRTSAVRVQVDEGLVADCTRVSSVAHRFIGRPLRRCALEALTRVRAGVRLFLDIDRRVKRATAPPPDGWREDWWPRQGDLHLGADRAGAPADALYASVASNDWTSTPGASHTAAVRLKGGTRPACVPWEVPVAGGLAVSGDLYLVSYEDLERDPPPGRYPRRIDADELAALARAQKTALSLK